MKSILILVIIFSLSNLFALSEEKAEQFIQALVINSTNIENYVLNEERLTADRLGISYYDNEHKWMISYDIDSRIKELLNNKQLDYSLTIDKFDNNYFRLSMTTDDNQYQKQFYFYGDKFVSPITFYTQNWEIRESKYFKFFVSDPSLFNEEIVTHLEEFLHTVFQKLLFTANEKQKLEEEKITYVLCKDSEEIKEITGFNTRGIYILASDAVVTAFNCHYHEFVHLLINYKLKELAMYTHPLLLEGIAVALGGRGGKEPEIITDMGYFLEISDYLSYKDLLSPKGFYQNNSSISYPVSGLYVTFLLENIGVEAFLQLYLKYSSNYPVTKEISPEDLPHENAMMRFMNNYSTMDNIQFPESFTGQIFIEKDKLVIEETEDFYYFQLKSDKLLLTDNMKNVKYKSKKFKALFPDENYQREKYLILVNEEEINIYNLYTNNLIACYVSSFSLSQVPVPRNNGWFQFAVRKSTFDSNLRVMNFKLE